jgi:phage tail-like protein
MSDPLYPFHLFRFAVEFRREGDPDLDICRGAFAECTGLEATMETKTIKAGGANFGAYQRAGRVTFATVILKRGITTSRDLWKWFSAVNEQGKYAVRLDVTITVGGHSETPAPPGNPGAKAPTEPGITVRLFRAMPVKFKCGDLNAKAPEVGIEELHLVHEGLTFS